MNQPQGPDKPAFPMVKSQYGINPGMFLRDYFAGQALITLVPPALRAGQTEEVVRRAYEIADAMMVARDKSRKK
ncbi:MAG: hypothetical protein HRU27_10005 [Rhizobiaceae bacterium]|nr:hypothetical protein [Hyphomicrobiales bacterium]NRB30916.1 hypothetical protein [Rhizobiaceae bacterium]